MTQYIGRLLYYVVLHHQYWFDTITLLLHYYYTTITLLLHYYYTTITLLLHVLSLIHRNMHKQLN